jgi:hypothetical protein
MKKFEKEVEYNWGENKMLDFIYGLIEGRSGGDWTPYKEGDIIVYEWEGEELEEDIIDMGFDWNFEDLKEFVGEGITISYGNDFENVKFVGNNLVVEYKYRGIGLFQFNGED